MSDESVEKHRGRQRVPVKWREGWAGRGRCNDRHDDLHGSLHIHYYSNRATFNKFENVIMEPL